MGDLYHCDVLPSLSDPPKRSRRPLLFVAVVVALLAAAGIVLAARGGSGSSTSGGGELGAPFRNPTTTASTAVGPTTTVASTPVPPAQKKAFDELMAQVAQLRGLQWKAPLNLRLVSKDDLAKLVRDTDARDADPNQVKADEATLKLLGLIPASTDYAKLIEDLFAEQVLGFYDPETKALYVGSTGGDGPPDAATRWVISHEMTHALTDQVFNWGPPTIALDKAGKSEESAAYSAMLEGDAVLLQTLWAQKYLTPQEQVQTALGGGGETSVLDKAPAYVKKSLYFPYDDGLAFVQNLYDAGGYAAVDAAYRKPPTSTEQILHPETYRAGQSSASPSLPDVAAGAGCQPIRSGIIGQFDMTQVLDEHLSTPDSTNATLGWNGDGYQLVTCGSALGLADRWETDPGTDPAKLYDALRKWAVQWSGSSKAVGADGRFAGSKGAGSIVRSGTHVDLVLAEDATTADKLARAFGS